MVGLLKYETSSKEEVSKLKKLLKANAKFPLIYNLKRMKYN